MAPARHSPQSRMRRAGSRCLGAAVRTRAGPGWPPLQPSTSPSAGSSRRIPTRWRSWPRSAGPDTDTDTDTTGERWGVWAAEGPQATAEASAVEGGWLLNGVKPWCSGATLCTHALITAQGPAGRALYSVALDPERTYPQPGGWQAAGLTGSSTEQVHFHDAPAFPVGGPGDYLTRPGFWHGAVGVAAVWWGAAAGIAEPLYAAARDGRAGAHALAHLGAVETSLRASAALLRETAAAVDASPAEVGEQAALTVRAAVESTAAEVIDRVGRALGPAPLCLDRSHARRVADLTVYLRQSHAERDLERIATLTAVTDDR